MAAERDKNLILEALKEARKSEPVPSAFCVGAVIAEQGTNKILATGYSRELAGNTHAEANAIDKLQHECSGSLPDTNNLDMATTMEPCSVRLSGNIPCVKRILDCGIKRVIVGVEEPADFVNCEGTRLLTEKGVQVVYVNDYAQECLEVARGQGYQGS